MPPSISSKARSPPQGARGSHHAPILSLAIPERHCEVDVKTAYVPGLDALAIKISPGFFDSPKRGAFQPQRAHGAAERRDRCHSSKQPSQRYTHGGLECTLSDEIEEHRRVPFSQSNLNLRQCSAKAIQHRWKEG